MFYLRIKIMFKSYFRLSSIYIVLTVLVGCSYNDLTDLWPSESGNEEEIVIREIATDSFDPEDTEEVTLTKVDENDNTESVQEITILDNEEDFNSESQSIDTLLETSNDNDNIDEAQSITNNNGKNASAVFTYVGQRIIEMEDEYNRLNTDIRQGEENFQDLRLNGIKSAQNYHSIVAAIAARLQIGTTPGNPILLSQYENAQTELADVGVQGQSLVEVGNQIALFSTRVSYLLEQARSAKKLRGAVDQDHRNLSSFEDALKRRSVDVLRILQDLNETVRRRDIFLAAERRRLTQLANAISIGESTGLGLGTINSLPAVNSDNADERRTDNNVSPNPIAIFRIDEQENYEQNLYGAISATLDKSPKSKFTFVAVSSSAGNASEQAERAANVREDVSKVISSLVSMGMPVDRVSVSTMSVANVENTEIRLYAD
ncbi:MAG: hypothetical protein CMP36_03815 [Rickettsiales bacterium]|nr:hypothetical protein [Rickettsiales bacterium]